MWGHWTSRTLSVTTRRRTGIMLLGGIGKDGAREMPEREPDGPAELAFDLLDRVERLPGALALAIAVLDDQAAGGVRSCMAP
jgi:hypothetical protein